MLPNGLNWTPVRLSDWEEAAMEQKSWVDEHVYHGSGAMGPWGRY